MCDPTEPSARAAWEMLRNHHPELLERFEHSSAPLQEAFEIGFRVAMVSMGIQYAIEKEREKRERIQNQRHPLPVQPEKREDGRD